MKALAFSYSNMPGRAQILVVDDSELLLARISARLSQEGYRVRTATGITGATQQVAGCELVLIDFHMPEMDGARALSVLRKAAQSAEVAPAYFLYTADRVASRDYRALGFDGSLINKGDDESLVQQMAAALRFSRLRQPMRSR